MSGCRTLPNTGGCRPNRRTDQSNTAVGLAGRDLLTRTHKQCRLCFLLWPNHRQIPRFLSGIETAKGLQINKIFSMELVHNDKCYATDGRSRTKGSQRPSTTTRVWGTVLSSNFKNDPSPLTSICNLESSSFATRCIHRHELVRLVVFKNRLLKLMATARMLVLKKGCAKISVVIKDASTTRIKLHGSSGRAVRTIMFSKIIIAKP